MGVLMLLAVIFLFPFFLVFVIIYAIYDGHKKAKEEERLKQEHSAAIAKKYYQDLAERERLAKIEQQKKDAIKQFHDRVFPMVTDDPKISAVWNSAYPLSMHDMPEKVDRQKRAMYNATPLLIDPINMSAFFWPSVDSLVSRIYRTSLSYCTCPDHQKHAGPCKHIYRLFYELTHIPYENPGIIDEDSSITNTLSDLSDSDLYDAFWRILHPSNAAVQLTKAAKRLMKSGVFQKSEPTDEEYTKLLNTMTKDQLILDLQSHGIDGFYKSWSKVRLVAWVIENQRPFLQSTFKDYAILSPAPSILPWIDGIKISQRSYRIYVSDQSFSLGYTPYKFQ